MPRKTMSTNNMCSEDEFDTYPAGEFERRRLLGEDETVDVLSTADVVSISHNKESDNNPQNETLADDSFVLPILLDIDDSEDDDLELLRVGPGGYREKGVRDFEEDGSSVGGVGVGGGAGGMVSAASATVGGPGKKRRR